MLRLAAALLLLCAVAGCKGGLPVGRHPHGAPPGQVKKLYRCGTCGITKAAAGSCHGKVMILVP